MLLDSLIIFIIIMMPIGAAKQRRSGIAVERSDGAMERGSVYDDGNGDKHNLIVPSDAT